VDYACNNLVESFSSNIGHLKSLEMVSLIYVIRQAIITKINFRKKIHAIKICRPHNSD
jgi:hypothetical protein